MWFRTTVLLMTYKYFWICSQQIEEDSLHRGNRTYGHRCVRPTLSSYIIVDCRCLQYTYNAFINWSAGKLYDFVRIVLNFDFLSKQARCETKYTIVSLLQSSLVLYFQLYNCTIASENLRGINNKNTIIQIFGLPMIKQWLMDNHE